VVEYAEGVFIGYRAWERAGTAPLFPFGHGLGYTTWAYESLTVDGGVARVRVRNEGDRAGREVVQLYLSPAAPDGERPARWLAGFAAAEAGPGQAVELSIPLAARATQVWADGGWRERPGEYRLEAAHSLADRRLSCAFTAG
jgi:beta-glucosidase